MVYKAVRVTLASYPVPQLIEYGVKLFCAMLSACTSFDIFFFTISYICSVHSMYVCGSFVFCYFFILQGAVITRDRDKAIDTWRYVSVYMYKSFKTHQSALKINTW